MITLTSHSMKSAEIRSRIEPELKEGATRVLADCGLNLSDAIRLFLRQVVINNGLPFEIKIPNAITRAAMEEAASNRLPHFNTVEELFDDLEKATQPQTR
jgi:DNA-damage-inducible protein J